jgi:hypothetical protein
VTKSTFNATIPRSQSQFYSNNIDNPGPGAYNFNEPKLKKSSFSRSKSTAMLNTNPGVGRYQITKDIQS